MYYRRRPEVDFPLLWTAVVWMKEWEGLEGSIMYMLDSEIGKRDCTSAVSSLDTRSICSAGDTAGFCWLPCFRPCRLHRAWMLLPWQILLNPCIPEQAVQHTEKHRGRRRTLEPVRKSKSVKSGWRTRASDATVCSQYRSIERR